MGEARFRKEYIDRIQRSLDDRVSRWKQIAPASYKTLPDPIWEYLGETNEMFVDGHFIGAVLLCAAILETALGDQIKMKFGLDEEEVKRFGLDQMIILCITQEIITPEERLQIDKLKKLRNELIHSNIKALDRRAKSRFLDSDSFGFGTSIYLNSIGGPGIREEAASYIKLVRDLTVRLYGVNDA